MATFELKCQNCSNTFITRGYMENSSGYELETDHCPECGAYVENAEVVADEMCKDYFKNLEL